MKTSDETHHMRIGLALLRITLGIIILATWYQNLNKGLYTADGLTDFFGWLADEGGNGGTLSLYHQLVQTVIVPVAGVFAVFQLGAELLMGLGLLLGAWTRLSGLGAIFFFMNLFLAYFGGHEWIWTYVLLLASALAVTLGSAGRLWGADVWRLRRYGQPRHSLLA